MDQGGDPSQPEQARARAEFFQQYYGPIASHSRHGLAVTDTGSCVLLFANARFLASNGMEHGTCFPVKCPGLGYGQGQDCASCGEAGDQCAVVEACRLDQPVRREVFRGGGDGLPARVTSVFATPLSHHADGDGCEVLIIEKEGEPAVDGKQVADEEREHLAAITRHSADAIIGLDLSGRIRSWNAGAVDTFGFTAEETLGRDFLFLVPDDAESRRDYESQRKEIEHRRIIRNHKARRVAKGGRTVVVTCTSSLMRGPDGSPLGVSLICRDVTLEVLMQELIDQQIRAMSVTHEIGDVLHSTRGVDEILHVILLGVTAEQGLGFNRAFLLLVEDSPGGGCPRLRGKMAVGPSNAEEAGQIWSTLSDRQLSLMDLYQMYVEHSATLDVLVNSIVARIDIPLDWTEHVLIRALASKQWVNVLRGKIVGGEGEVDAGLCELLLCDTFAVIPLSTREKAIGVLLVDNRITRIGISDADLQMLKVFANHAGIALENSQLRANLERRLEELAQLNQAMRESQIRLMQTERLSVIGEMAARVVHEIRNPLVSIGGFARLMRRGLDPDDPRSDYLRIISDEVSRLERIVQHLLDFSRPRPRLELGEVRLNGLVREIVAMATMEAEAHGVKITQSYDKGIGRVTIDGDRTRQVLLNLIRNALEAMLDKGHLLVETAALEGDRFRVTIQDSGPGIPADQRDSVFEPGFTTRRDGTGFGLAIAKRLVELQGGQISMRDSKPRGCIFDIVLPRLVRPRTELEKGHGFRKEGEEASDSGRR
ncbi:MAG: ATP-binding protein [Planctomycetota bacterium]